MKAAGKLLYNEKLLRVTKMAGARCDPATTRPGEGHDTAAYACDMARRGLQHGEAKPATRCSALAVCVQARPRVGALCTRLSFDSVHYSESLFGTMFMNTVLEHSSRGFQK